MSDYYNVTTNVGDAAIATAIANNTKLNITHIAFGDGSGAVPIPNKNRTALVNEVHRQAVTKYQRHATIANYIVIETVIPSSVGGFNIREVGIIADGVLISHGSHAPFFKVADPDGVSEYRLKFTQNVTDGNVVEISLDESLIFATQAWVDENYVPRNEIVDNLTTNDSLKPVSAKQAKILKDSITTIEDIILYAPIAWPSTTIPGGYLAMMGQTISQAQYPKLYALYGSKLPDMRAYSIKGLDYGRGIDSGRSILTEQGDAIRNISGHITPAVGSDQNAPWVHVSGYSGVFYPAQSGGGAAFTGVYGGSGNMGIAMDVSRQVPTATENRVKNIAFLYIVKAG